MLLRRLHTGWCWERSYKKTFFVSQYQHFLLSTVQTRVAVSMPLLISHGICCNEDKQSPSVCWQHAEMPSGRHWLKGRHHSQQKLGAHWWCSCVVQKRAKIVAFPDLKMPYTISWFSGVTCGESLPLCQESWDGPGQHAEVRAVDLHLWVENELLSRVRLCVKSAG